MSEHREVMSVTPRSGYQQADSATKSVTPAPSAAADRMRRMRARRREAGGKTDTATLLFERPDWLLFLDTSTLPQKAGCQPHELGRVVLKELVDNALDAGASVTLDTIDHGYIVRDDGPGIDPAEVPRLFAVNRPLVSSKLKRLPLRGMLGNGLRVVMGAVAAMSGTIAVTTRGHKLTLAVDPTTGATQIERDDLVPAAPGTAVKITLRTFTGKEAEPARLAIAIAKHGHQYPGPSRPEWYGSGDLHKLFASVVPETATVGEVLREAFGLDHHDRRRARDLDRQAVAELHTQIKKQIAGTKIDIGGIGSEAGLGTHYAAVAGIALIEGAEIPYTVECWASCDRADRGNGFATIDHLLLNRSPSLAHLQASSSPEGLSLHGCGIHYRRIAGPKTAQYALCLSLVAPYVRLASDGKTPVLPDFEKGITEAIRKAAGTAFRAMVKPPRQISIKDAAWAFMEDAYLKASDGGKLPANARQIMYAARPPILYLTGADKLDDAYFTQTLLPDFIVAHPQLCANWDVVFDARGHFVEPHTGRTVPLGTIEVRDYLGMRPWLGPAVEIDADERFPTVGPANRYRNILFIEKEGFGPLLQQARIAGRFDLAIMSTKGMSVTASRLLLDRLAPQIANVFVLHDFDIAGFSIFGTLAEDGRRYVYDNAVPLIDIGLRLDDVEAMDLQSEAVTVKDWEARRDTLKRHGAIEDEIAFLRNRRVELNAMTSRQFVDFLEAKLVAHDVEKVIPNPATIAAHAQRLVEQRLAEEALAGIRARLADEAATIPLPTDLEGRLRRALEEQPELSWDAALATIIRIGDGQ